MERMNSSGASHPRARRDQSSSHHERPSNGAISAGVSRNSRIYESCRALPPLGSSMRVSRPWLKWEAAPPGHFRATPGRYPVPCSRTEDARIFIRVGIPRWLSSQRCWDRAAGATHSSPENQAPRSRRPPSRPVRASRGQAVPGVLRQGTPRGSARKSRARAGVRRQRCHIRGDPIVAPARPVSPGIADQDERGPVVGMGIRPHADCLGCRRRGV